MSIDDVYRAICENPEDDALRLEYAELIEPSDPVHAACIRQQINEAQIARGTTSVRIRTDPELGVLQSDEDRWTHNLAKFARCWGGRHTQIIFHRGFPAFIEVDPFMFLEYAELLFRLAPLRHIRISDPWNEDGPHPELPVDEILACPQLARLDSFGFTQTQLPEDIFTKIAACPHLTRCQFLKFEWHAGNSFDFRALLDGELTRKMLRIHSGNVQFQGEHTQDFEEIDGDFTRTFFRESGKEAERRHGYIPWLHPSQNRVDWQNAVYFVERGIYPKFPAGSLPPKPEWYDVPDKPLPRHYW